MIVRGQTQHTYKELVVNKFFLQSPCMGAREELQLDPKSIMSKNMIDVLIIGAGPTGLLMAAEAMRNGMKCRIIDKVLTPSDKSRALAIQPRTLEILDHLGIATPFLEQGTRIKSANQICRSKILAHFSFETLDSPFPFVISLEQGKTEAILTEHLASFGIRVEREIELIDIEENGKNVLAICQDLKEGKEMKIEAKYAIGCDGAHSIVRKKLGFSFVGKAFPSAFSLADVKIKWKHPHDELYAFLNPEGIMAAIPMPGEGRYRLVFELARCKNLLKEEYKDFHGPVKSSKVPDPTLDEVKALVRKYGDNKAKVSEPLWLANFHINSRLVDKYQRGRIFIAGDAAHIHSPAGGQGMNSGLQDAFNLAWKLKTGNQELIDTYTLERRSWGKNLLQATQKFTQIAALSNPVSVFIRNMAIEMLSPFLQDRVPNAIAQLSIQYPKSEIAFESGSFNRGPRAGMRAPNVPIENTDLYSLMRKSKAHHLLVFGSPKKPFREFESKQMDIVMMDHPEAKMKYGVKKQAVYIIRPDQYVGHRSSPVDFEAIRKYYRSSF